MQDPVASQVFRLLTTAAPERVWAALTCPLQSRAYLHGLSVSSGWQAGGPVAFHPHCGPTLEGTVLRVDPGRRLVLTVEEGNGCCTYLDWQLRRSERGTVVRLKVDETGTASSSEEELEDVWLPVLHDLDVVLRREADPTHP